MPKLNKLHIVERLQKRIEQLENGESLEARDINKLLNPVQQQSLKAAWVEQQNIRNSFKTKSAAEAAGLSWLTIREVRLIIYRQALADAVKNSPSNLRDLLDEKETRAARVYLDAYFSVEAGSARNKPSAANIALTRAGLRSPNNPVYRSVRDCEIRQLEEQLKAKLLANMTPDQLEELIFIENCEAESQKNRKDQ